MAKARKKASKRRSKAKKNPVIDYGEGWSPSEGGRWAKQASRAEIEERLALVRAEIESPSSDDEMYRIYLYGDEGTLERALKKLPHPLREEPEAVSGEFEANPKRRKKKVSKVKKKKASKRRSKAKKNPALISGKELGYFYEDGVRDFNGSALVGQNLSGMDLRGATFRDANLYNVNFSGADLRGVDFRGADLGDTDFRGAKVDMDTLLEGVNIKGSLGPPQYYRGDMKITPQEMFSHKSGDAGVAPFAVEQTDDGFMVVVDPSSGVAGSIKPESFGSAIEAMDHADSLNREVQGLGGESSGQVQDYANDVRMAKAKIKEVESMEPTIRGRHLDEVLSVMDMVVEDFRGSRGTALRDYTAVSPAVAPLYVMGSLQFLDPDKGQEFLDRLAELGLRMPYTAGDGPKGLIPLDREDALQWHVFLEEYNEAYKELREARAQNPGKRRSKRKASKRKAKKPHWKLLLDISQHLWETYDDKPLKRNLVNFGVHSMAMKEAKSVKVRAEGARAHRAYKREMKAHGWKEPKITTRTREEFEEDIRKARAKGAKKPAKKKATKAWSASDIKGMQEFHDRKLGAKKKATKRGRKNPSGDDWVPENPLPVAEVAGVEFGMHTFWGPEEVNQYRVLDQGSGDKLYITTMKDFAAHNAKGWEYAIDDFRMLQQGAHYDPLVYYSFEHHDNFKTQEEALKDALSVLRMIYTLRGAGPEEGLSYSEVAQLLPPRPRIRLVKNPKRKSKKRVTKKAAQAALDKSSVPWEWVQQKPGRIVASKGKRTVELRKWFKGPLDQGWVVSVIEDGKVGDEYWASDSILEAIETGEKVFKKPAKKKAKKKATKRNPYRDRESLDALQTRYWEQVGVLDWVRRAVQDKAPVTVMRGTGEMVEGEIFKLRDAKPGMVVTVRVIEKIPGQRHSRAIDKHVALKHFIGMNPWLFDRIDDPNPPEAQLRAMMEGVPNPKGRAKKNPAKRKATKKKATKPRRNARRVSKAKLIAGLNETLDEFRKSEKKLMEESGISYRDPLADTVIREEGRNVMLHFDGAGYDYLSVNSDYESTLRQDVFDKAESLGWEGDDYSCYAMEFFAR